MKIRVECLAALLLSLSLPMAAQSKNQNAKTPFTVQVFNAEVQVNGPDGLPDGHDAPPALLVKAGRGADGGLNNANGGLGGGIRLRAGDGGGSSQDAGNGGNITLIAGAGGESSEVPGGGGSITLQPGASAAFCGVFCSAPGNVILAVHRTGSVGVGTNTPSNTLEVVAGGTTLADSWTVRSSRRFKTNILPLVGALEKVEQLQGVSYERKDDGKREIGVIAEDVDNVMPEVVSRDPKTHEVQGVDYSRLAALLIEAVKTQQVEIEQLKSQIERLNSAQQPGQ
jgi:hypothetical protein